MRLDTKVLLSNDECGSCGQAHRDGGAAAVTHEVNPQGRATLLEGRLQLAQRFKTKRGGAVGRRPPKPRHGWRMRVLDDSDAHQRDARAEAMRSATSSAGFLSARRAVRTR